jgi:hypothetical protein
MSFQINPGTKIIKSTVEPTAADGVDGDLFVVYTES